jgi:NAD(P)-dependent dehydrogenase (short-subunit alcohol dehydrogenase family)
VDVELPWPLQKKEPDWLSPLATLSKVDDVKKEIETLGSEAIAISCDVSKKEDVIKAVAETVNRYGAVDIL